MMTTRVIVCGSRSFEDRELLFRTLDGALGRMDRVEVVSGHSKGADLLAEAWAGERGIPFTVFSPDWKRYGRVAGPKRNGEMLAYARQRRPLVLAFWDGKSRGTKNMIRLAEKAGVEVRIVRMTVESPPDG